MPHMAIKKITRKVITQLKPVDLKDKQAKEEKQQDEAVAAVSRPARSKRECFFCQNKSSPSYTDLVNLRRFLTDRAKIVGKERSGICSRHQRGIARNIKYARHLALLPFVPKV